MNANYGIFFRHLRLTQRFTKVSHILRRGIWSSASKPEKLVMLQWGSFLSLGGLVIGGGIFLYKERMSKPKDNRTHGKPSIGGDFNLVDHTGKPCTLADFAGKWVLMYFGFCRCPDICPEQLERIVDVTDRLHVYGKGKEFVPVFVTVDADRDTPEVVAEYVKEFSPRMIGLTGTKEEVDRAAKTYRIYYSIGPKDVEGDYIVDHTIVMYLLDPKGEFADYYGQLKPVPEITSSIMKHMKTYK